MRGTVSRFGGGVVNPKSRVPVKMSVKRRNAALNRKDKAQMAGWALDAIWGACGRWHDCGCRCRSNGTVTVRLGLAQLKFLAA